LKDFFKLYITHSNYIFKFWTTQVSMSVFGIIVSFATFASGSVTLRIIGAVFSIAFFIFLMYDMMFNYGFLNSVKYAKDKDTVNPWEGLKIAALSYAPTMLFTLIYIILDLIDLDNAAGIIKIILFFLFGSYDGILLFINNNEYLNMIIPILLLIPGLAACTLGFQLGIRDKPIRKMLGINISPPKAPKNK